VVYQQIPRRDQITTDTIAAVATAPGYGGIGVVRVSGPLVESITRSMLGEIPAPRHALLADFLDQSGETMDHGIAIYFPAPHSFTGEDVLELQGHGGPVVLDMMLEQILAHGARLARPGEFSERAFLNGKMDLVQVEAIADLIHAGASNAARAAVRSLTGEFSRLIHALVEGITRLRIYVEAAIDFPEEEIDFLADGTVNQSLTEITANLRNILQNAEQGRLVREGVNIVLAGKPNTGKSSLLNYLAREDRAIVSDIAGTTRDTLSLEINLKGLPVHIIDTAGLRNTDNLIEKEGVRRAGVKIAEADLVLHIVEPDDLEDADSHIAQFSNPEKKRVFTIVNKVDLTGNQAGFREDRYYISAKTGAGIEQLIHSIHEQVGFRNEGGSTMISRRRHINALIRAERHIGQGAIALNELHAGELLAEELRLAQQALSEITGDFTSDDLLGRIFSDFCIGK